jgi:sugar transferase (PEP-CTERM/EpsH1 system associated)
VRDTVRERSIRKAVVFSSSMAQYVDAIPDLRVVVDFVDVDSEKWGEYARSRAWPMSSIYERERARLCDYERAVARRATASVFVTPAEADLFRRLAPECAARVVHARNGVDTVHFSPDASRPSPYAIDEEPIVFTGAMDYWPNVDAVSWFAREAFPAIRAQRPRARFYVVGMQPSPIVQALARAPAVVVTGTVPDVRPYLQHARVVVAPLRVARGIQNKVLEAMAMARPVVVSGGAASGISAVRGVEMAVADGASEFVRQTLALFDGGSAAAMGAAARARVMADYDWTANLAPFADLLEASRERRACAG